MTNFSILFPDLETITDLVEVSQGMRPEPLPYWNGFIIV